MKPFFEQTIRITPKDIPTISKRKEIHQLKLIATASLSAIVQMNNPNLTLHPDDK
tara:strand:- start:97 stop:261 length:165 start_codon:yes stop_codon:yes gene_type:complete